MTAPAAECIDLTADEGGDDVRQLEARVKQLEASESRLKRYVRPLQARVRQLEARVRQLEATETRLRQALAEQTPECAICLEAMPSRSACRTLTCKHTFHKACITNWLKQKNTCPTCRAPVKPARPGKAVRMSASSAR